MSQNVLLFSFTSNFSIYLDLWMFWYVFWVERHKFYTLGRSRYFLTFLLSPKKVFQSQYFWMLGRPPQCRQHIGQPRCSMNLGGFRPEVSFLRPFPSRYHVTSYDQKIVRISRDLSKEPEIKGNFEEEAV